MHPSPVPQRVEGSATPPMNGEFGLASCGQVMPGMMLNAHSSVDVAAPAVIASVPMTTAPPSGAPPASAESVQQPADGNVNGSSFPAIRAAMPVAVSDPLMVTTAVSVASSAEAGA